MHDRAKILQIGRFIRFPSKFAAVGFLPTKERSFPKNRINYFYVVEFKTNVKRAEQKNQIYFCDGFSEK